MQTVLWKKNLITQEVDFCNSYNQYELPYGLVAGSLVLKFCSGGWESLKDSHTI